MGLKLTPSGSLSNHCWPSHPPSLSHYIRLCLIKTALKTKKEDRAPQSWLIAAWYDFNSKFFPQIFTGCFLRHLGIYKWRKPSCHPQGSRLKILFCILIMYSVNIEWMNEQVMVSSKTRKQLLIVDVLRINKQKRYSLLMVEPQLTQLSCCEGRNGHTRKGWDC